jgi:hypothetical protein
MLSTLVQNILLRQDYERHGNPEPASRLRNTCLPAGTAIYELRSTVLIISLLLPSYTP